jgi:electron transfer flavoprotein beta subunit
MEIVVLCKQVPDLVEELEIDTTGKNLNKDYTRYVVSESDDHALEEAILLKERYGGKVYVYGIDKGNIDEFLFTAVAKGADEVYKINYSAGETEWLDNKTSASLFLEAIKNRKADLILTGCYAVDDLDGQLGPTIAGYLNLPFCGLISGVELSPNRKSVVAYKEYPGGIKCALESELPAVLGIQSATKPPRYVSVSKVRQVMKTTKINELNISIPPPQSSFNINKIYKPVSQKQAKIIEGTPEKVADELIQIFKSLGIIK